MNSALDNARLIRIANLSKEHKRLIEEKGKVVTRMDAVGITPAGLWALTLTYTEIENRISQVLTHIRENRVALDRSEKAQQEEQKDQ